MINEQIRCKEVRVIGEEGQQLGVMALRDALNMAKDAGVDLVMVSPSANPPVCRIVDYGKFKYEQLRREKEAKKKQKTVEVKEVRLSPNIDVNDLNTKCNSARKFIEKGNKVKVSLRFRGREMAHIDSTKHILEDFAEKLSDIAVIEKAPKMEGRSMMVKTKRAAAKRFKVTGTGKLKRMKAYKSHILTKKSAKRKRNLRQAAMTDATNVKTMKKIMPYL